MRTERRDYCQSHDELIQDHPASEHCVIVPVYVIPVDKVRYEWTADGVDTFDAFPDRGERVLVVEADDD